MMPCECTAQPLCESGLPRQCIRIGGGVCSLVDRKLCRLLAVDHHEGDVYVLALAEPRAGGAARSWVAATCAAVEALAHVPASIGVPNGKAYAQPLGDANRLYQPHAPAANGVPNGTARAQPLGTAKGSCQLHVPAANGVSNGIGHAQPLGAADSLCQPHAPAANGVPNGRAHAQPLGTAKGSCQPPGADTVLQHGERKAAEQGQRKGARAACAGVHACCACSPAPHSNSLAAGCAVPPFRLRRTRERYLADVEACLAAMCAGESYELCLTTALARCPAPDAAQLYSALRRINPAPYAAFLAFGDGGPQVAPACFALPPTCLG